MNGVEEAEIKCESENIIYNTEIKKLFFYIQCMIYIDSHVSAERITYIMCNVYKKNTFTYRRETFLACKLAHPEEIT